MFKFMFNIVTSSLSLPCDYLIGLVIMEIIGQVAYSYAYNKVGEMGLSGDIGSLAHWTIRLGIVVIMWYITSAIIKVIRFVMQYWIYFLTGAISVLLIIGYIFLAIYAYNNDDSILNKNIIKF